MASHLILRVLLVITSFGHIIEFISALLEKAYVTAIFAISFAIIELIASYYVDECNCDKICKKRERKKRKERLKRKQQRIARQDHGKR